MNNKDNIRCALWNKTSKNGLNYSYGKTTINGKVYKVVLFANTKKKNEKSPDYSLILMV